jgi:methionine biosynthesis protein MetW
MLRSDLRVISELIHPSTSVLDLGCGDGALLDYLIHAKDVKGRGIDVSEEHVLSCVRRGLSVRQGSLEEGMADYPDKSFDCVVLSQTLPYLDNPAQILEEMLRVGQVAIVSFPNWGYWRCRLELIFSGRIPMAPDLPQSWHDYPRWQALTIEDFIHFCSKVGIVLREQVSLSGDRQLRSSRMANWRATTTIYILG